MNAKEIIKNGLIRSAVTTTRGLESVRSLSEVYHKQINSITGSINAIKKDTSRTHSEKAILYKKVSKKLNDELGATLSTMIDQVGSATDIFNEVKKSTLYGGDKLTNLHLATHIRDNKKDALDLLVSDVRYAQASTEFPASFFGLDQKVLAQTQNRALMKNIPELAEQQQMIEHSNNHAQRLIKFFDGVSAELSMMTDENALANRVDESTL